MNRGQPSRRARHEPGARGISLLHVGGVEIRVDYSWFLIFFLIWLSLSIGYLPRIQPGQPTSAYWVAGGLASLLFFVSILLHELSHTAVARASGIAVPRITLFLFGGVSQMKEDASDPKTELEVAAVGPLASLALAGAFWVAYALLPDSTPPLVDSVVFYLAWINAALAVFNLLPGFPLDGGRLLRAAVWWRTGDLQRATRIASDAGKGLAVGLMILGGIEIFAGGLVGGLWLVLIGMFLRSMAESSYQSVVMTHALADLTVADAAIRDPVTVGPDLSVQALVDDYVLATGYRAFPVVERGSLRGLVSLADLKDLPAERRGATRVRERMTPIDEMVCVPPDLPLVEAVDPLAAAPEERLLVVRGSSLVGMLTRNGVSRALEIRRALRAA